MHCNALRSAEERVAWLSVESKRRRSCGQDPKQGLDCIGNRNGQICLMAASWALCRTDARLILDYTSSANGRTPAEADVDLLSMWAKDLSNGLM